MASRIVAVMGVMAMVTSTGYGGREETSPDDVGIIPPVFFMTMKDADLLENSPNRYEDAMTTSDSGHRPLSHLHLTSSDSFMSLVQAMSGRHFELPETEGQRRPRQPTRFAKRYKGSTQWKTVSGTVY
ncbi:uncharacterized protein LOC110832583 [Zootermopsis nevadensis]|uniref:Uncharacterized protein n=1 Tax=Zootermopsis nevadensis TaxID=136037 RepID=A0A067RIY4_ZOONE|nr:uncharacterized protein LOC110832583 [Zootermopsis nevadensis]KDR23831.1 hypothetical protein L798_11022 [Zootermopsis nevadensis]